MPLTNNTKKVATLPYGNATAFFIFSSKSHFSLMVFSALFTILIPSKSTYSAHSIIFINNPIFNDKCHFKKWYISL